MAVLGQVWYGEARCDEAGQAWRGTAVLCEA
jgi:hypothetical protein